MHDPYWCSSSLMNTTNQYHHLHGLLPSKPPPWRHRHRPHRRLHLPRVLAYLLVFFLVHHARPMPLLTILSVNTSPTYPPASLTHFGRHPANRDTKNTTLFHCPLLFISPTPPRPLHTNTSLYLPQIPTPAAPIVPILGLPTTHLYHTNSYVNHKIEAYIHRVIHKVSM